MCTPSVAHSRWDSWHGAGPLRMSYWAPQLQRAAPAHGSWMRRFPLQKERAVRVSAGGAFIEPDPEAQSFYLISSAHSQCSTSLGLWRSGLPAHFLKRKCLMCADVTQQVLVWSLYGWWFPPVSSSSWQSSPCLFLSLGLKNLLTINRGMTTVLWQHFRAWMSIARAGRIGMARRWLETETQVLLDLCGSFHSS